MKSKPIKALAATAMVAARVAVTSKPATARSASTKQANADCVWSYAYCSSVGAYRRTGDVIFL
ncbi:hypothetical protein ABZ370_15280 [Streptomyces sp. NPDC005962]|uniref:hypothetical protein n=1 Tax=Streptomyces sp. NPDC005962 TaxID=3154466 RepID=UPI0033D1B38A